MLSAEVGRIESPEEAEAVVQELEALAGGATAGQRASSVAKAPETAVEAVQAAAQAPGAVGTAAALSEAAAQVVAPTPESPVVAKAVADVLPPREAVTPPETRQGQRLLREALLRHLDPVQKLDTRVFLAVNGLTHPPATDASPTRSLSSRRAAGSGWSGWRIARLAGVPRSGRALRLAAPSVIGATWFVERPIKALFRRRRPFIDIVRALVIGRRPDGWSFPSGHTAAAFSGAWVAEHGLAAPSPALLRAGRDRRFQSDLRGRPLPRRRLSPARRSAWSSPRRSAARSDGSFAAPATESRGRRDRVTVF